MSFAPNTSAARHLFLAMICLLLCVTTASAQEWKSIKPEGMGLSIEMPGDPQPNTQVLDLPTGKIEIVIYVLETPRGSYYVNSMTIPENAPAGTNEERLKKARNGAIRHSGGKLVKESNIMLDGNSGIQLLIEGPMKDFAHSRVFLVGNRIVQAVAVTDSKDASPDVKRFLDSLKLTTKKTKP